MSEIAKNDSAAEARYLLGDLSEDEEARMEEAFFADDSKFEALELAEDELIDAYVREELSPEERRQFRAKLLKSPRLAQRVSFAGALAEKARSISLPSKESPAALRLPAVSPETRSWRDFFARQPAWGMAAAVCALVILVGGIVLVFGWLRLKNESQRLAAERLLLQHQREELNKSSSEDRSRAEQLAAELQRAQDQRAEDLKLIEELRAGKLKQEQTSPPGLGTFATILLTPGVVRGGSGSQSTLTLGPETTTARVQLVLDRNDYPIYAAAIKKLDGAVVFEKKGLKPHQSKSGTQLSLSVPSRLLNSGDYIVHVNGITTSRQFESVNDYTLRVSRKSN